MKNVGRGGGGPEAGGGGAVEHEGEGGERGVVECGGDAGDAVDGVEAEVELERSGRGGRRMHGEQDGVRADLRLDEGVRAADVGVRREGQK